MDRCQPEEGSRNKQLRQFSLGVQVVTPQTHHVSREAREVNLIEQIVKLKEENAKLKQELEDAWDILKIQREASAKRESCSLCRMSEPQLRAK